MTFIFSILFATILWFIIAYLRDTSSEKNTIAKQGGMYGKYRVLISHYEQMGMSIVNRTGNSITLFAANKDAKIKIVIEQLYNKLWIKAVLTNNISGEHQLDWEFSDRESQELMIEQIDKRIDQYVTNMQKNHFQQALLRKMMFDD